MQRIATLHCAQPLLRRAGRVELLHDARLQVSDDCPPDWRCETSAEPHFCKTPPKKLAEHCESSADCSEEAAYCETYMSHVCLVKDCAKQPAVCPSEFVCCDVSALVGESLCLPRSTLTDGKCIGGTLPVTR